MIPVELYLQEVEGAYAPGGYDAGDAMKLYYPDADALYPILPDPEFILIDPDTEAGTWGLAWYRGLIATANLQFGRPRFAVRDDVVLTPKIGYHESTHALEEVLAWAYAAKMGISFADALDYIRTKFFLFRQFPGTWREAMAEATTYFNNGQQSAGWAMLPGEMIAEAGSAAVGGIVQSEWTFNWGRDLAILPGTWETNRIYAPIAGALSARAFFKNIMEEAQMLSDADINRIADAVAQKVGVQLNSGFGLTLNQKLRRAARWIRLGTARDPGGVGGTDKVGYADDNDPLA